MRVFWSMILLCLLIAVPTLAQEAPVVTYHETDFWGDQTILYDLEFTRLYPQYIVGEWCSFPEQIDGSAAYHLFHPDGSYNYMFLRTPIFVDPRISMNGSWAIVDNKVEVRLTTFTYIDGIESIHIGTAGFRELKGGQIKSVPIDPPIETIYELYDLHYTTQTDLWDYPWLDGDYDHTKNLTALFSGTRFFKLSHTLHEETYPIIAGQICGTWASAPPWSKDAADAQWTFLEDGTCERTKEGYATVRASWRIDYGVLVIEFDEPEDGRTSVHISGIGRSYEGVAPNDVLEPGVPTLDFSEFDWYWKVD